MKKTLLLSPIVAFAILLSSCEDHMNGVQPVSQPGVQSISKACSMCINYSDLAYSTSATAPVQGAITQGSVVRVSWWNSPTAIEYDVIELINESSGTKYLLNPPFYGGPGSNGLASCLIPTYVLDGTYTLKVHDAYDPAKYSQIPGITVAGGNRGTVDQENGSLIIYSPTQGIRQATYPYGTSKINLRWYTGSSGIGSNKVRILMMGGHITQPSFSVFSLAPAASSDPNETATGVLSRYQIDNTGNYLLDTSGFGAGSYTVVIEALDGQNRGRYTTVSFNIQEGMDM
ncbi:hypothetical protein K3G63_13095 [Hymenobacter sp. HSC-4F20]|uniref:hypothetical protein n=1 Tax=Hymenobacter sp. HSC-4F20 TaxID=2864135 RepID=UPI001C72CA48|nr:hypothetical protein [Hymenobacter sp. HSC-4F20]MBX0291381.1 hypothetical protein [Hymenobacter sp. HSC-4F20]